MKNNQAKALIVGLIVLLCSPVLAMAESSDIQKYPDVVEVEVSADGDNGFDFSVTLSSPYDTPQRYADAFRVMSEEGDVYGVRELLHDHAGEQPFTRRLTGVAIPEEINTVIVQGRDQEYGYGGKTMEVDLPRR